jgi:hypothetical protein
LNIISQMQSINLLVEKSIFYRKFKVTYSRFCFLLYHDIFWYYCRLHTDPGLNNIIFPEVIYIIYLYEQLEKTGTKYWDIHEIDSGGCGKVKYKKRNTYKTSMHISFGIEFLGGEIIYLLFFPITFKFQYVIRLNFKTKLL